MPKPPSDSFPTVVGGSLLLLVLLLHSIYEDLLKEAVFKYLSSVMGMQEAELISRLTEMAAPIVGMVVVIGFLSSYLKTQLSPDLAPRLSIAYLEKAPFVYDQPKYRCYRFAVKNETNLLIGSCKAQMESAYKSDGTRIVGIPFSLRRSFASDEIFTLRGGEEVFVDLLAIPLNPQYGNSIARIAEFGALNWPEFGSKGGAGFQNGPIIFTIQVLSDASPVRLTLKYEDDGGEWKVRRT